VSQPDRSGLVVSALRELCEWLEYGEFESDVDKMKVAAWINALSATIKALVEVRDV
jgi:hypothetical protein